MLNIPVLPFTINNWIDALLKEYDSPQKAFLELFEDTPEHQKDILKHDDWNKNFNQWKNFITAIKINDDEQTPTVGTSASFNSSRKMPCNYIWNNGK